MVFTRSRRSKERRVRNLKDEISYFIRAIGSSRSDPVHSGINKPRIAGAISTRQFWRIKWNKKSLFVPRLSPAMSNAQGKLLTYHEKCGRPASEVTIGGLLTSAKAVLCHQHKVQAERESFVSANGFSKGKVEKKSKEDGYIQAKLPGTGVAP